MKDIKELVELIADLNDEKYKDEMNDNVEFYNKFMGICEKLNCTYEGMSENLSNISRLYLTNPTNEWKCILLSFYILTLINFHLDRSKNILLSVQQSSTLKACIENIAIIGIRTKVLPSVPFYLKCRNYKIDYESLNILQCTTLEFCELLQYPHLRLLILPEQLKYILCSLYQISFGTLKKPAPDEKVMTEKMYETLLIQKTYFVNVLETLKNSIHPSIYVKNSMVILQSKSPAWFKKAVSRTLTSILRSENGIENVANALLDGATNDVAQTWRIVEVLSKLILSCKMFPDFEENICKQLSSLLDKVSEDSLVYERIYEHCTKKLYEIDSDLSRNIFIRPVISYFLYFTYKTKYFCEGHDLTRKLQQNVRLLHGLFIKNAVDEIALPLDMLKPIVQVLFRFYSLTLSTSFKSANTDLKSILSMFIDKDVVEDDILYDSLLFGMQCDEILSFRNDIDLKVKDDKIVLKISEHSVSYSTADSSDSLIELIKCCKSQTKALTFFGYLLKCLNNKDKYFKKANEDLLNLECEIMNECFERSLSVYKLLSELAEDKIVQQQISEHPEYFIQYVDNVLRNTIKLSTHKRADVDSEGFQSLFTILMILQNLVADSSQPNLEYYKILTEPLDKIAKETGNKEMSHIIDETLKVITKSEGSSKRLEEKTELDVVIEDICDPLLPVRGHGLMVLSKLVEKRDAQVMERKQYVLNIFQQNLKNEDSYLYLSSISGLSAMADIFPDLVLSTLCEEYCDSSRKSEDDGYEVRMKIGECLVRATRCLGDMAPKYKTLLLNTFLNVAKDEDDLMRASSLSNLGEICRVLGYKLGTIVTEVLVCVHAIISTDKSPQARRAAVTVIRQLFVGLDQQMITFLKDDILPIYRTLKQIYNDDEDDVMRLQAQLALDELNENMKKFAFPRLELSDKNIVMLN